VTTEDDFQAALDVDPDDWQTRLVFADWLQECNDRRADGYRLLGLQRLRPHPPSPRKSEIKAWTWGNDANPNNEPGSRWHRQFGMILLPRDLQELLFEVRHPDDNPSIWKRFTSRREAEDAAALAFTRLAPERRAELLAGALPPKGKRTQRKSRR
jgi:uncharacterized protein (TIGR02996 family)